MAHETGAVINPVDTQVVDMELELKPPTPSDKVKKLRAQLASAKQMSKMMGFPEEVRKNFISKADIYEKQLKKLERV